MHSSFANIVLAALCAAPLVRAQNPDPLPDRLVGNYSVSVGENKARVGPVELADIKVAGEMVTGNVANYRSPNGICYADKTPFNGTYQNGLLVIKSMPLVSQRSDGHPCGGVVINVRVSAGRASGTYRAGPLEGLIELEAIPVLWSLSTLAQNVADKPDLRVGDEWIFVQTGNEDGTPVNRRWRRKIVETLQDDKIRVTPRSYGIDVFDRSWNPRHPERPNFWPLDFQFPLRLGARWSYASPFGSLDTKGQAYDHHGSYKIAALESISVPAGTFKCFRIEGESSWITTDTYKPEYHYVQRFLTIRWYCPDIKNVAKSHVERDILGFGIKAVHSVIDSELLEFRPGKLVAPIPASPAPK